jgi:hypothetical protein
VGESGLAVYTTKQKLIPVIGIVLIIVVVAALIVINMAPKQNINPPVNQPTPIATPTWSPLPTPTATVSSPTASPTVNPSNTFSVSTSTPTATPTPLTPVQSLLKAAVDSGISTMTVDQVQSQTGTSNGENQGAEIYDPNQYPSRYYAKALCSVMQSKGYEAYEVYVFGSDNNFVTALVGVLYTQNDHKYLILLDPLTNEDVFSTYDGNGDNSIYNYMSSDEISIGGNMWISFGASSSGTPFDFGNFNKDGDYLILFGRTSDPIVRNITTPSPTPTPKNTPTPSIAPTPTDNLLGIWQSEPFTLNYYLQDENTGSWVLYSTQSLTITWKIWCLDFEMYNYGSEINFTVSSYTVKVGSPLPKGLGLSYLDFLGPFEGTKQYFAGYADQNRVLHMGFGDYTVNADGQLTGSWKSYSSSLGGGVGYESSPLTLTFTKIGYVGSPVTPPPPQ